MTYDDFPLGRRKNTEFIDEENCAVNCNTIMDLMAELSEIPVGLNELMKEPI